MSQDTRKFILALLNRNPKKRLGAGPNDAEELKAHKFFADTDWEAVANQTAEMPRPR